MTHRRVLADTGPVVALVSPGDAHYTSCTRQLADIVPPLLTSWAVITEAAWLLRAHPDRVQRVLGGFDDGFLQLLPLTEADARPIAAILSRYRNLDLQLVDASLLHLADRERPNTVFTTDRRDFSVLRLPNNRPLTLLPDLPIK